MRTSWRKTTVRIALLLLVCLVNSETVSSEARRFSGTCDAAEIIETNEFVTMAIVATVFNHGEAEVTSGIVRLKNPRDVDNPLAVWSEVNLAARQTARFSEEVDVPVSLRDAWVKGIPPVLTIEYPDPDGPAIHTWVQVDFALITQQGDSE